jgi:hypothetical protein
MCFPDNIPTGRFVEKAAIAYFSENIHAKNIVMPKEGR